MNQLREILGGLRTETTAARCGALGVASGYAIFLTYRDIQARIYTAHNLSWLVVWGSLGATALVSYFIEGLRETLQRTAEEHENPNRLLIRATGTFLVVLIFEIFLAGVHTAVEGGTEGIREATNVLLGEDASSPGMGWTVFWAAFSWVVVGAAMGVWLSRLVRPRQTSTRQQIGTGAAKGLAGGLVIAPLIMGLYVLLGRCLMAFQLFNANEASLVGVSRNPFHEYARLWHGTDVFSVKLIHSFWYTPRYVLRFAASFGIGWFWAAYLSLLLTLFLMGAPNKDKRARALTFWAIAAALVSPMLAPVVAVFQSVADHFDVFLQILLLAALIWALPGLLLGALVPLLRREAKHQMNWAVIGYGSALLLAATSILLREWWPLILAAIPVLTAIVFQRGVAIREYWPFAALSVALGICGLSSLTSQLTFAGEVKNLSRLQSFEPPPLAIPSAFVPETEKTLLPRQQIIVANATRDWKPLIDGGKSYGIDKPFAIVEENESRIKSETAQGLDAKDKTKTFHLTDSDIDRISKMHAIELAAKIPGANDFKPSSLVDNSPGQIAKNPIANPFSAAANQNALVREGPAIEKSPVAAESAAALEVAITSSVGFWMTMGLLGCWAIRERGATGP